jgi:hypothetical protein
MNKIKLVAIDLAKHRYQVGAIEEQRLMRKTRKKQRARRKA